MKKRLLFLLLISISSITFSQITGNVTDSETGEPLIAATVRVADSDTGTITDFEGNFSIEAEQGQTLIVSYVGYVTQEVIVDGDALNITLTSDLATLEEIVVIGYGEADKEDITGSISRVTAEDLEERPSMQVAQAIQGKASGVQVINSGQPGQQPTLRIRGANTVLGGQNPIYVVDGVIVEDITNINPQDITSIDVLKDPSSLAIYGMRGANGVVIVTTKRGADSKPQFSFTARGGMNTMSRTVDLADSRQFAEYINEALINDGDEPQFDLNNLPDTNTDWLEEITRQGIVQNYFGSVRGGNEDFGYSFSLGLDEEEGILEKNKFQRISGRFVGDYHLAENFTIGTNLNLIRSDTDNPVLSAFQNAYNQSPLVPVQFDDGTFGYADYNNLGNPAQQLSVLNNFTIRDRFQGNVFGEWEIIDGLTARSTFGVLKSTSDNTAFTPTFDYIPGRSFNEISDLSIEEREEREWLWENTLTYDFNVNEQHYFNILGGVTSENEEFEVIDASVENVPNSDNYWYIGAGDADTRSITETGGKQTRYSYLGRLQYDFDDRYLLTGSVRYDASSKFPVGNKGDIFPALGLGWKLTSEDFMANQNMFDFLKIRGSWGVTANDVIPANSFIALITANQNYDFSGDGEFDLGNAIDDYVNTDLTWETTTGMDIGFEAVLLDNRFDVEFDYFTKISEDVLLNRSVANIFDGSGSYLTNLGEVENKGFEVSLGWEDETESGFGYAINWNGTKNENMLLNIFEGSAFNTGVAGISEPTIRVDEGQPLGSFYVFQTDGIFQSQEEIDNYPTLGGTMPGDLKFVDTNGDGILNDDDRVYMGSHQPDFFMGTNLGFNYGNWGLNVNTYAQFGGKIYNGKKSLVLEIRNIEESRLDRWTPQNPSNTEPRATFNRARVSDYYLEDGDFFRINTINLSYDLPASLLENWKMNSAKLYLNAQNPVTFQKFSGYQVEFPGSVISSGIEQNAYPLTSNYSIGINLGF